MKMEKIDQLIKIYEDTLRDNVIPFWMKHFPDWKNGGYYNLLDRDGSKLSTDKHVWIQGRGTWIFSKLYNSYEKREEFLEIAKLGYDFLIKHCFSENGHMYFQVTEDGKPLIERRYWFSESFATIAFAEYYKATGNKEALNWAKSTYNQMIKYYDNTIILPPKVIPETREQISHAETMILISTTQVIREVDDDPIYETVVDKCIDDIFNLFVKADRKALLETVGPKGKIINTPEGRCINPGHAIETAWFLITEGLYRDDQTLINNSLEILDWSLDRGWDKEYGGIFYYVDLDNKTPLQLEWDMKLWWPHVEALYALLLASCVTGDAKYEKWYDKVHEWSFNHFPDSEHGEWYGYLHRDGTVSLPLKGTAWKGPFHLPRLLIYGLELLKKYNQDK